MNNHNEVTTSLMGRPQSYDDTAVKKRLACLTSTVLICFLLAAASLGVSVIVLLKHNGATDSTDLGTKNITSSEGKSILMDKMKPKESSPESKISVSKPSEIQIEEKMQTSIEKQKLNPIQIEERPRFNKPSVIFVDDTEKEIDNSISDLLCGDDSDLCKEGSGDMEDHSHPENFDEEGSGFFGSGDEPECPTFSRPICPVGAHICYDYKGPCSIPICCLH